MVKKIILYKITYSRAPNTHIKNKKIIELDLSSYATKSDLENATGVNKSKFAKKTDLASLKSDFDDVDIDQLQIALVEISKLCNVVKMKL